MADDYPDMKTLHIRDRCPATVKVWDIKGDLCQIRCGNRIHPGATHDWSIVWDEHETKFPSFLAKDGTFYAGRITP